MTVPLTASPWPKIQSDHGPLEEQVSFLRSSRREIQVAVVRDVKELNARSRSDDFLDARRYAARVQAPRHGAQTARSRFAEAE
jgi:hypothetical protein